MMQDIDRAIAKAMAEDAERVELLVQDFLRRHPSLSVEDIVIECFTAPDTIGRRYVVRQKGVDS